MLTNTRTSSVQVELVLGPATETLQKLIDDGEAGTFDMAFIDAGPFCPCCRCPFAAGAPLLLVPLLLLVSHCTNLLRCHLR